MEQKNDKKGVFSKMNVISAKWWRNWVDYTSFDSRINIFKPEDVVKDSLVDSDLSEQSMVSNH